MQQTRKRKLPTPSYCANPEPIHKKERPSSSAPSNSLLRKASKENFPAPATCDFSEYQEVNYILNKLHFTSKKYPLPFSPSNTYHNLHLQANYEVLQNLHINNPQMSYSEINELLRSLHHSRNV